MVKIVATEKLQIPQGVTVAVNNRQVSVTGPRGMLTRDMRHLQLDLRVLRKGRQLTVRRWFGNRTDLACMNTAKATIRNMIIGVTKGYRLKLRFAYAHFPINVSVEGQKVEIRNFLGEKRVRRAEMPDAIKVYRTDAAKVKDELCLEGNDLEQVSHAAAQLHELCLVKNKDIRMFLDGIYVQTKEPAQA